MNHYIFVIDGEIHDVHTDHDLYTTDISDKKQKSILTELLSENTYKQLCYEHNNLIIYMNEKWVTFYFNDFILKTGGYRTRFYYIKHREIDSDSRYHEYIYNDITNVSDSMNDFINNCVDDKNIEKLYEVLCKYGKKYNKLYESLEELTVL